MVPARLSAGVAQLGRDLRAIVDGFRGVRPASFQQRAARPSATPGRALVIDEVVRETADAVSLWLVDPAGAPIHFTPGQFLTVLTTLDGVELRRAYSPSSSASAPGRVRVTIKRVAGGRVSSYLHEAARVGGRLRVLGPSGAFTLSDDARGRDLVLIAGGSGITPIRALLDAALERGAFERVTLLYGNRSADDIIFRAELEALARRDDRLRIRHVLERPSAAVASGVGRLDRATAARELRALGLAGDLAVYACGPAAMLEEVRAAARELGVSEDMFHEERFTAPERRAAPPAQARATAIVRVAGEAREVVVEPGETVLEAGLAAGLPMPYSCAMGGCGACRARLVNPGEGDLVMEEPNCLDPAERAAGYVLPCVDRPRGRPVLEIGADA